MSYEAEMEAFANAMGPLTKVPEIPVEECRHLPTHVYAWAVETPDGPVLCSGCCACGTVLPEQKIRRATIGATAKKSRKKATHE